MNITIDAANVLKVIVSIASKIAISRLQTYRCSW